MSGNYTTSPQETPDPNEYTSNPLNMSHGSPPTGLTGIGPKMNIGRPASYAESSSGARRRTAGGRNVTLDTDNPELGHPMRRDTQDTTRTGASRRGSGPDPNAGILRRMTTGLFTPPKKVGKAPTYWASLRAAATCSWLNVLLIFIPIGWALYLAKHAGHKDSISDTAVFVTTFIAIIPLAGLLGFATEEAALRMGQTLGGLLNATLGNAVELIVAILALIKCELAVVQSSLVGSILSNILLVLGMCFFAGGVRFAEQAIKSTAAQLNASLLLIAVIAVLIPSAFHLSIVTTDTGVGVTITDAEEARDLLAMSHGVAVILLVLYLGYLLFQMWTHAHFYSDEQTSGSTYYPPSVSNNLMEKVHFRRKKHDDEGNSPTSSDTVTGSHSTVANGPQTEVNGAGQHDPEAGLMVDHSHDVEEQNDPQMNITMTILIMVLDTVLVGVTAEFLVDSINGLVESNPALSQEWVGLILLPIVGNAAEHFTAVSVSVKDKLDLSISVAVGSSIQIALFVIPVIELLAWTIGKPLLLLFDPYESVVLFLSVLIVNQTLADGRSNWMEGLVLMFLYLIIAVTFWYYPGSDTATLLGCKGSGGVVG